MKKLILPIILLSMYSSAQAQLTLPRLIAQSTYRYLGTGFTITDSSSMSYSAGRGMGKMEEDFGDETDVWLFDVSKNYSKGSSGNIEENNAEYRKFDNNNNITSYIYTEKDGSNEDTMSKVQVYYTNSKIDSAVISSKNGSSWKVVNKYIVKRDGQQRIIEQIEMSVNMPRGPLVNSNRTLITYSGNNKSTEENQQWNIGSWMPSQRTYYVYSGNNLTEEITQEYDGSIWENTYKETRTYDSKGNMLTNLSQEWDQPASQWENLGNVINTYDAQGNRTSMENQQWVMGSFQNNNKVTYTYDNNHNELTQINQQWVTSAYVNQGKTTKAYNKYNYITSEIEETWNAGTGKFEAGNGNGKTFYYYEEPTGIHDLKTASNKILLYPNPTSSTLHIEMKNADNQPFSMAIYDVTGKAVKYWNEIGAVNYDKTIDVSNLSAGTYYLRNSANLRSTQQFSVLR